MEQIINAQIALLDPQRRKLFEEEFINEGSLSVQPVGMSIQRVGKGNTPASRKEAKTLRRRLARGLSV